MPGVHPFTIVIRFLNQSEMLFSKAKFSNQISGTGYHLNLEPPIGAAIGLFFMSIYLDYSL
jgi:hypothetical protein